MRAFDCIAPDGTHSEPAHFEADDDEGILRDAREHAAAVHPSLGLTDEQLRGMIAQSAYDK